MYFIDKLCKKYGEINDDYVGYSNQLIESVKLQLYRY